MDILEYQQWSGTRADLVKIISELETKNPQEFGLISKTGGHLLPIKSRRIQQFIDLKILPIPQSDNAASGKFFEGYDFEHLTCYLAAIRLKNKRYTTEQTVSIIASLEPAQILEIVRDDAGVHGRASLPAKKIGTVDELKLKKELKKLGRKEGRVLRSEQVLLAVTPWCHLHLSKEKFKRLSEDEIEVIINALALTLRGE